MVRHAPGQYSAASLFGLQGKKVLLTGASGFLGRTMLEALLDNGATILALGASDRVEALTPSLNERYGPGRVQAYRVDLHDVPAVEKMLSRIDGEHPVIDVIVNNAHELG